MAGVMTNEDIWAIALEQSALEFGCAAEDFLSDKPVVTESRKVDGARSYLPLPFECDMVTYGSNVVAQTSPRLRDVVTSYLNRFVPAHALELPNLHVLAEALLPFGLKLCFMAEYFLPDLEVLKPLSCPCELRLLERGDFSDLYVPEWGNALSMKRPELDVLCVGAYDGERLVGLAGCSADCKRMYQIGVDVLPEYRRRGIAAAMTSRLALEIVHRGRVPFYCAAWCNMKSVGNAVKCGFRPAWAEVTARDVAFVDALNGKSLE